MFLALLDCVIVMSPCSQMSEICLVLYALYAIIIRENNGKNGKEETNFKAQIVSLCVSQLINKCQPSVPWTSVANERDARGGKSYYRF